MLAFIPPLLYPSKISPSPLITACTSIAPSPPFPPFSQFRDIPRFPELVRFQKGLELTFLTICRRVPNGHSNIQDTIIKNSEVLREEAGCCGDFVCVSTDLSEALLLPFSYLLSIIEGHILRKKAEEKSIVFPARSRRRRKIARFTLHLFSLQTLEGNRV